MTGELTLRCQCSSCDAVGDLFEAGIQVEHFCWGCLLIFNRASRNENGITDLRVFAALEERSDANEANIVIPHHNIILVISRYFEGVLEDCNCESAWVSERDGSDILPSKLSRPVFSRKLFFSLL